MCGFFLKLAYCIKKNIQKLAFLNSSFLSQNLNEISTTFMLVLFEFLKT